MASGGSDTTSSSAECSGEKLVPHPHARSRAWKYFGFRTDANGDIINNKKIVCRLCQALLAYSGNTSNLSYHLEREHLEQFKELKDHENPRKDGKKGESQKQQSLQATLNKAAPYPKGSPKHKQLLLATADFICHGFQPVSVVDEPSFRTLMATADPRSAQ